MSSRSRKQVRRSRRLKCAAMEWKAPSPDEVAAAQTERGGWTRAQLKEWGVPWPPPNGWRVGLAVMHRVQEAGL